jgi:RND family efflux transporter MFP subunit
MPDETQPVESQNKAILMLRNSWPRLAKPAAGLAALIVLILWSVGAFHQRLPPGRLAVEAGFPLPEAAACFTVKSESIAPRVDVVGTVASDVKVNISARLPAYVNEIFVSAGSPVKKGQALVVLDDRELKEQVKAAEAQSKQAETEYNRTHQLFDNKASTEQALTAAQSMLTSARAQWERSKVMLTYTRIVSPMDGIVTDRRVEPGDLANPGRELLAVYDPANMRLEAPVPMRLIGKLPIGQNVEITLDRPARVFQGQVRQIVSEIDPLSRTQLVKVLLDGDTTNVLPGTFGRLWVHDDARPVLLIPASAVYAVGQVELVQVVKDGRVIRRAIRTGPGQGDLVEALAGIEAGDVVLVHPVKEL